MAQSARRLRQIFAAYSDKDAQVVDELAHVAPIFGSRYLIDRTHLEPGEDRHEGVQRLIRGADMFQLFWSSNSMRSDRKSTRLNSSHVASSYAVFCLKKKKRTFHGPLFPTLPAARHDRLGPQSELCLQQHIAVGATLRQLLDSTALAALMSFV